MRSLDSKLLLGTTRLPRNQVLMAGASTTTAARRSADLARSVRWLLIGLRAQCLTAPTDFMVWTRGSRDDYDRWANVTGDDGWGWDKLEPYMRKVCGARLSHVLVKSLTVPHRLKASMLLRTTTTCLTS